MVGIRQLRAVALAMAAVVGIGADAPRGTAEVAMRLADGTLLATITLDRPTMRFRFDDADVVRGDALEVTTPGLTLANNTVTAPTPFRTIALRLREDVRQRDAKYPPFYTVGRGGLVYLPTLAGEAVAWRTRFRLAAATQAVRLPTRGDDGYAFIGPATMLRRSPTMTTAIAPDTPGWLAERSQGELARAIGVFAAALGTPLPVPPLLVVRTVADARATSFVGDVTDGPVVALRYYGSDWATETPAAVTQIRTFVAHEAFHFWNGSLVGHAPGTPTWLHEGGADYAAPLADAITGSASDATIAARLSTALTRCRRALEQAGDRPLSQVEQHRGVRYPCGTVVQWLTDVSVRRASGGRRTVLSAWGDMIRATAKRADRRYTLADFDRAVGGSPARMILESAGGDRWQRLPAMFAALGLPMTMETSPADRLPPVLLHLTAQSCRALPKGSSYGFSGGPQPRLQTPAGCGVLAGDPVVVAIEGSAPNALDAATYAAIQRRCAAGEPVRLVTGDGRTIAAPCTAPLADAPQGYVAKAWRPAT